MIRSTFGAGFLFLVSTWTFAQDFQPPVEANEPDPYGIENPEEKGDQMMAKRRRDWTKHPGFFHAGIAGQFNFATAPSSISGAATGTNGAGFGGMLILDYDYTRGWLYGLRMMVGFKRYFVNADEDDARAVNIFPISIAIQRLLRVSRIATFRYGLGIGLEIIDAPNDYRTDNSLFLTLDFDFPYVLTGVRGYLYNFVPSENFLAVEVILGIRF